jgi:hypothetical protein
VGSPTKPVADENGLLSDGDRVVGDALKPTGDKGLINIAHSHVDLVPTESVAPVDRAVFADEAAGERALGVT